MANSSSTRRPMPSDVREQEVPSENPAASASNLPSMGTENNRALVNVNRAEPTNTVGPATVEKSNAPTVGPESYIESYTIAWVCALQQEFQAARQMLDQKDFPPPNGMELLNDSNAYTFGKVGGHYVVVGCLPKGRVGLVNAAFVAKNMTRSFPSLKFALMVGIGGGAPLRKRDIRLGDVVVGTPSGDHGGVVQLDFGVRLPNGLFHRRGHLNAPPDALLNAIQLLQARQDDPKEEDSIAKHIARMRHMPTYGRPTRDRLYRSNYDHRKTPDGLVDNGAQGGDEDDDNWEVVEDEDACRYCAEEGLVKRPARSTFREVTVHYGTIASDNVVMMSAGDRDKHAKDEKLEIHCFEMEAAGLMNNFPCLVIRGISDYSDSHKNYEWHNYAALAAAAYAREILLVLRPQMVAVMPAWAAKVDKMEETRGHVEKQSAEKHREAIDQWLSAANPSTNYYGALKQRQPGTGQWLLKDPRYSRWTKEPASFLWLHGIPGCGKTVLSTTVIENLKAEAGGDPVLYFYFSFTDVQKQSAEHAIRALVGQLYHAGQPDVRKPLDECFKSHTSGREQPNFEMLRGAFQEMAEQAGELWIVLDALDECNSKDQKRGDLLKWIQGLARNRNVHLLVTSRPEGDIRTAIEKWAPTDNIIPLQSDLVQEDISSYIQCEVSNGERLERWHEWPDVQKEIRNALMEKADGMFRWVSCQLDELGRCLNYPMVREALRSLPKTLDDTYSRILCNLPECYVPYAKRLLQFLAFSERPLRIEEAVDVLAIESKAKPRFDEKNRMPRPKEIAEYCASLVIVTGKPANHYEDHKEPEIREIQLAHFSVQTYLVSDKVQQTFAADLQEPTARAAVAETCLAYLLELDDSQPIRLLCSLRPLAEYAARYWAGNAARGSEGSVHRLAMELFTNQHIYRICWLLYAPDEPWEEARDEQEDEPSTLYYASLVGLKRCVKEMLRERVKVNAWGGRYGSALQAASVEGHLAIVRLLLEHKADVNIQGGYHGSALQAASARGHLDIARLLLEYKADINAQGGCYGSALQAASENGHLDIVRLLREQEEEE